MGATRAWRGRRDIPAACANLLCVGGWLLVASTVGCGDGDVAGGAEQGQEASGDTDDADATGEGADASEGGSGGADAGEDGPVSCGLDAGALPFEEGAYIPQGESHTATRDFCTGSMHAVAGAAGSVLGVTLSDWPAGEVARVRVENLLGEPIVDWTDAVAGDTLSVSPPLSGEVLVRIEPTDPEAATHDYTLSVACEDGCDLEYTRYPVLLMHGMAGTETYINVLDYWFQMEAVILPPGFNVQIRVVEAFQGTEVRGQQWIAHVEAMIDEGIGRRFNLIGHSQGGLDARLITASPALAGRISSVVTVASPHQGTPAAEVLNGTFEAFPIGAEVADALAGTLGGLLGLSGDDLVAQIADFTPEAMVAFNAAYPDVPGVYYASWAGHSCGALDFPCQLANNGEVVDTLFAIPHGFLLLASGDNDGLVPVQSAQWGDYQGTVPADHMDEVGQIADVFNPAFDHKQFYLGEIRRLAALGH